MDSFDENQENSDISDELKIQPSESQLEAEKAQAHSKNHQPAEVPLRPSELLRDTSFRPSTTTNNMRYTTIDDDKFGDANEPNTSNIEDNLKSLTIKYDLKVILIGDISVGKTSVLGRFIDNKFDQEYKCTVGSDTKFKTLQLDLTSAAKLAIWDTAGEEKFRAVTRNYFKDAQGAVIVFDLTNYDSFTKLNDWIEFVNDSSPKDVVIAIVGNKADLSDQRKVTSKEALEFAKNLHSDYYEVSAKTGSNVALIFEELANKMAMRALERQKKEEEEERKINEIRRKNNQSEIFSQKSNTQSIRGSKLIGGVKGRNSIQKKKHCC